MLRFARLILFNFYPKIWNVTLLFLFFQHLNFN
ncbi:Hypothetical Cytosolic Protein [Fusobacterium vincentii ATCC 49256]|uniref:Hypothetical Cytosolic Protein n=1 Tax=Fusobacterium vincentii ATCC 49256 TaxID=209882 RepID=Q7P2F9_FUSVC|nr:Hypothetical Cytosolic Protein [Fusobacterium vincentii ATCC 49256]